jgi:hypothetical protein
VKNYTCLSLVLAFVILTLTGCSSTSSTAGGIGGDNSFKLHGPALATAVHQGKTENVKMSVKGGKDFKSDVAVSAEKVPTGLKVELKPATVKAGESGDFVAEVTATADATVGEHKFTVKGTPTAGSPTTVDVTIKVEK